METINKARTATQDYGAERFIRNNADAGILGAAGLEAVRVVLDHLIDTAKTDGDAAAVEAMYALEVDLADAR